MKANLVLGLLCAFTFQNELMRVAEAAQWEVLERNDHETIWQSVDDSEFRLETNRFVQLQSGLNYLDNGQFREAKETVLRQPNGGFVADQAQHKVKLPANINTAGGVELRSKDGKAFKSHVLGLSYFDPNTGESILIAGLKDSPGVLVGQNQVVYFDALDDVSADIRYTFTRAGLEQDIILLEQVPSAEAFGLNPETARLEVWTEFIEAPVPDQLPAAAIVGGADTNAPGGAVQISFGHMKMGKSRAFRMVDGMTLRENDISVRKQWQMLENRTFLIETVKLNEVAPQMQNLPQSSSETRAAFQMKRSVLQARVGQPSSIEPLARNEIASAYSPTGFVLDYVLVNGATDYVFKENETYFVSGGTWLYGHTVIEPAVIKYTNSPMTMLIIEGTVECRTGQWNPAVFTAKDDNSIGEVVPESSGSPNGYYAETALWIGNKGSNLKHLRIAHAKKGILYDHDTINIHFLSHSQIRDSWRGIVAHKDFYLRNVLMHDVKTNFATTTYAAVGRVEHLTVNKATVFNVSESQNKLTLHLTNAILREVSALGEGYQFSAGVQHTSDAGEFEKIGAAANYLSPSSSFHEAGTTTITPSLLLELSDRTTYAPTLLSGTIQNATFVPIVKRGFTTNPSLGYHYDPLDYILAGATLSGIVTVRDGVALGIHGGSATAGVTLSDNAEVTFSACAENRNVVVRYNRVQEQVDNTWVGTISPGMVYIPYTSSGQILWVHDTVFIGGGYVFVGNGYAASTILSGVELHKGTLLLRSADLTVVNSLFRETTWYLSGNEIVFDGRNNLFWGGSISESLSGSGGPLMDNFFHMTTLSGGGGITKDHNAYISGSAYTWSGSGNYDPNDEVLSAANFQRGVYGPYYLSSTSPLIDEGSVTAAWAGLADQTTLTSEALDSEEVDIGLHFKPGPPNLGRIFGSASQSSTAFGGDPARAIDGNANGDWNANSVTHTDNQSQPYWQVDLGASRYVDKISLWNRTDNLANLGDRLSNLYVFVSDTPFSSTTVAGSLAQSGVSAFYVREANVSVGLPIRRSGRYVRVQLDKTEYLSLAEVMIFGPTTQPPTVAITNPQNNQSFSSGASIALAATASDCDGQVIKVDFFAGSTLIGTDTIPPFAVSWNNVQPGSYTLSARATDDSGLETVSSGVSITVAGGTTVPIVDAGPDQTIFVNSIAALQGWPSPVAAGTRVSWATISGPSTAAFSQSGSPATTVSGFALPGSYVIRLTLWNTAGTPTLTDDVEIGRDHLQITALDNKPLQVDAGPDRSLPVNSSVTIVGSGFDDWGRDEISFQWTLESAPSGHTVMVPIASGAILSLSVLKAGTYVFKLSGSYDTESDTDEVTIHVGGSFGRTWTRNADFEQGFLNNVGYDTRADALTFVRNNKTSVSALSGVVITESHGNSSFLVRVDTDSGDVVGVHPVGASDSAGGQDWMPTATPKGMVNTASGDTLVLMDAGFANGAPAPNGAPAIIRFGNVIGGSRVDESGVETSLGAYLKPPFRYSTLRDRNGDGLLRVANDTGQVLQWIVTRPANGFPTESEEAAMLSAAQDETIVQLKFLRHGQPGVQPLDSGHGLVLDSQDRLWVWGTYQGVFRLLRLDPESLMVLEIVDPPIDSECLKDPVSYQAALGANDIASGSHDILVITGPETHWATYNLNTGERDCGPTLPSAPEVGQPTMLPAFAISPADGSRWFLDENQRTHLIKMESDWTFSAIEHYIPNIPPRSGWRNFALFDSTGDFWFTLRDATAPSYARFSSDGALVGVLKLPCTEWSPFSIAEDANEKMWFASENLEGAFQQLLRVDPARGAFGSLNRPIGRVDMSFLLPAVAQSAYWTALVGPHFKVGGKYIGTWTAIHDSGSEATWGKLSWTATTPGTSSIQVRARAAATESGLSDVPWGIPISNEGVIGKTGRFIELKVVFAKNSLGEEPILEDITVLPAGVEGALGFTQIALDDSFPVGHGSSGTVFDVLDNDKVVGLSLRSPVGQPRNGQTKIVGSQIEYKPHPGFFGEDRFVYTVEKDGIVDRALVRVHVARNPEPPAGEEPTPDPDSPPSDPTYSQWAELYGPVNINTECEEPPPIGNRAPVPATDILSMRGRALPTDTSELTINPLANDYDPDGNPIILIDDFPRATTFGRVRRDQGVLKYQPDVEGYGVDKFTYTVQDSAGVTATGTIIVNVAPVTPPQITLAVTQFTSPLRLRFNANVTAGSVDTSHFVKDYFAGLATGHLYNDQSTHQTIASPEIVSVEFYAGEKMVGKAFAPTSGNFWEFTWSRVPAGKHLLTAVATDELGLIASSAIVEVIIPKSNASNIGPDLIDLRFAQVHTYPAPGLNNGVDPGAGSGRPIIVTSGRPSLLFDYADGDCVGDSTLAYQVLLYRTDGKLVANLTPGTLTAGYNTALARPTAPAGCSARMNKTVTLDLTAYANGGYELEVRISDGIEEFTSDRLPVILRTGLKMGQFKFQDDDALMNTAGLPLAIIRSYDSSNTREGDFGVGWEFAINDLNIEFNEDRIIAKDFFTDEEFSLRVGGGRDVTLTLPDGRRTTFVFKVESAPQIFRGYRALWDAEPGVTATLSTPSPGLGEDFGDNLILALGGTPPLNYWQAGGPDCPPESYDPPTFILTLQDGTTYTIEREDLREHHAEVSAGKIIHVHAYGKARVTRIERPNREYLTINQGEISHYLPGSSTATRSLYFERGQKNRIIAVRDVVDPSSSTPALVEYEYDGKGNLVYVHKLVDKVQKTYATTTYVYDKPEFQHYITKVIDPRGVELVRNTYDSAGRVQTITDPRGAVTTFDYLTSGFQNGGVYGTPVVRHVSRLKPNPNQPTEVVTENEADALGNVIYSKAANGFRTWRKFEALPQGNPNIRPAHVLTEERFFVQEEARTYLKKFAYTSLLNPYGPTEVTDTHLMGQVGNLRITKYEYDNRGAVTKTRTPLYSALTTIYDENVYTAEGLLHQVRFVGSDPASGVLQDIDYHTTGAHAGLAKYTKDAVQTLTMHYYYENNENGGRFGDLKYTIVFPAGTNPLSVGDPENLPASALYLSKTSHTYDATGVLKTQSTWRYKRNADGSLQFPAAPNASTSQESYTTTWNYDAKGRVTQTIDPSGASSETVYNSIGKIASTTDRFDATTVYLYDKLGNVSCTSYADGTLAYQTTYFESGLKHQIVEDRHLPSSPGQKSTGVRTVFDLAGRVFKTERLKDITITATTQGDVCETIYNPNQPALVLSRTRTEYYQDGRVWKTIQENDLSLATDDTVTTYEHSSDQLTKTTKWPDVVEGTVSTTTHSVEVYDLNSALQSSQTKSWVGGALQPHRPRMRNVYDQQGRLKEVYSCIDENEAVGTKLRESTFDLAGRKLFETTWESPTENTKRQFVHDGLGRIIRVLSGYATLGQTYSTENHTVTRYDYDEIGNLIAEYDGNQFDASDNLVANAKAMRHEYDSLQRRLKRTLPTGTLAEEWAYDFDQAAGQSSELSKRPNVVRHKTFGAQFVTSIHDKMGRLYQKKVGSAVTTQYEYTATGQRARMLDNMNSAPRESRYVYDERQRLRIKDTPEGTLTYGYDIAGNLSQISARTRYTTFPPAPPYDWGQIGSGTEANASGAKMVYRFDSRNRLIRVNEDSVSGPADATYGYNPVGSLARVKYRNDVESVYNYNTRNQLTTIVATRSGSPRANFKYDDAAWTANRLTFSGQRRKLEETINIGSNPSRTVEYTYDSLGRLTKENCTTGLYGGAVTYDSSAGYTETPAGYDKVGNRRKRDSTNANVAPRSYSAYDANDRLGSTLTTGTAAATFDDNGNTLQYNLDGNTVWDQSVADGYDAENRLITATRNPALITMIYDGDGNRVRKTVDSTTDAITWFLVDDQNPTGYAQVIEERTTSSGIPSLIVAPTVAYVYGLDLVSQKRGTTIHYYGYDGLGSVRYLTDGTSGSATYGEVVEQYVYDGFGIQLNSTTIPNSFRYAGEQWDADLAVYYLRARYYHPDLGRFWTMDSYEGSQSDPLSLHKYLYCHADPVNNTDPSGMMTWEQFLGYDAEEAIQEEYLAMHPAEAPFISFGTRQYYNPVSYLKPDIFVSTPGNKRYLEIKPISTSGVAAGVAKMVVNATAFGPAGYKPDAAWQPLSPVLQTPSGETIFVINVGGVVFYQDVDLLEWQLITVGAVVTAKDLLPYLKFQGRMLLRPALARISVMAAGARTADSARLNQHVGIAGILALGGAL